MSVYRPVRKSDQARRLDRETWADTGLIHMTYDTEGVGVIETEVINFGLVFEKVPFFTYGVELREGETLVAGDFPRVSAGVKEWFTTEPQDPNALVPQVYYLGAFMWINIRSATSYRLRFRFQFEGTAFKNTEFFN